MTAAQARARWTTWLESLSAEQRRALGVQVTRRALQYGLAVHTPQARAPIAVTLTPAVLDPDEVRGAVEGARRIASAVAKVAGDLMAGHDPLGARILGELTPLERECIQRMPRPARLPAVRVDYFRGAEGPRALEVNATIPAMQGYSDAAARALCEGAAEVLGAPARAAAALRLLPSNRDQLLDALDECWASLEPGRPLRTLAIVHRPGDAQLPELEFLAQRASERGIEARLLTPDQVSLAEDGPRALGAPVDLVYRHVFGRRVEPTSPFAALLRDPVRSRVFNPLDAHLEAKAILARLSELGASGGGGLAPEEVEAVQRLVPWTRLAGQGPTSGPDGEPIEDPAAWAAQNPARAVLKRSWDYGGKSVILADRLDEPACRARAAALAPEGASWSALCAAAARAPELWVVQQRIAARRERHLAPEGWRELFVDLCAYTAVGLARPPGGVVVRAAQDPVVNIVGGGGLASVLTPAAVEALLG